MKQALDAFRVHRDDLSVIMVSVFLIIAQTNGITAEQIGQKVRLSQSAVSRGVTGGALEHLGGLSSPRTGCHRPSHPAQTLAYLKYASALAVEVPSVKVVNQRASAQPLPPLGQFQSN